MDVKGAQNLHNSSFLSKHSGGAGNKSTLANAFLPKLAVTATLVALIYFRTLRK